MISLNVQLKGRKVVVAGGGLVATRRVRKLLDEEACITVVSPELTEELKEMAGQSKIKWKQRAFTSGDVKEAFLVVIATNDAEANENIASYSVDVPLVNRADGGEGNVQFPAQVERGMLKFSVTTSGASPKLTRKIKRDLEALYPPEYEAYVDFLYEARKVLKQKGLSEEVQMKYLKDLLEDRFKDAGEQKNMLEEIHRAGEERSSGRVRK
ncbi:NAD(P)-binding protein [Halobacillus litoralis]|uniref:NAD(P)-binding protein n=1 Tax=Halobacillus litoralis TaxID=45668 RepID=UPI001CFCEFA6|nr:NAD(P)-binding protein [Halobacillus litoralis]